MVEEFTRWQNKYSSSNKESFKKKKKYLASPETEISFHIRPDSSSTNSVQKFVTRNYDKKIGLIELEDLGILGDEFEAIKEILIFNDCFNLEKMSKVKRQCLLHLNNIEGKLETIKIDKISCIESTNESYNKICGGNLNSNLSIDKDSRRVDEDIFDELTPDNGDSFIYKGNNYSDHRQSGDLSEVASESNRNKVSANIDKDKATNFGQPNFDNFANENIRNEITEDDTDYQENSYHIKLKEEIEEDLETLDFSERQKIFYEQLGENIEERMDQIREDNYRDITNRFLGMDLGTSDKQQKEFSEQYYCDFGMQTDGNIGGVNPGCGEVGENNWDENFANKILKNIDIEFLGLQNSKLKDEIDKNDQNITKLLLYINKLKSRENELKYKDDHIKALGKDLAKKEMELGILKSYNDKRKKEIMNKYKQIELKSEELRQRELNIECYEEMERMGDLEFEKAFEECLV